MRQELIPVLVLAPLGAWPGRTGMERVLLIGSVLVVLLALFLLAVTWGLMPYDRFGR